MNHQPFRASWSLMAADSVTGTVGIVMIAVVIGGIGLAGIAALLVQSLGHQAIDKVAPDDVPHVLGTLGSWIVGFTGFLPNMRRTRTASERTAPPSLCLAEPVDEECEPGEPADA